MTPSRPVLRYHGGKFRIASWVAQFFPAHKVYVEPFGGAASVLLQKHPARIEVYNDTDCAVVNLFRVLRDPESSKALVAALELTPFSRTEYHDCLKEASDPIEEARRLVVTSFQSIGTKRRGRAAGWRTRTEKAKWSPCAAWNSYPPALQVITDRLREVIIESMDWRKCFDTYDGQDVLWFVDPPYPESTRKRDYGQVYENELTDADHEELCHRCLELKGFVVLASYANPIYDRILSGWERRDLDARAQTNSKRVESLYISPRTAEALNLSMFLEPQMEVA